MSTAAARRRRRRLSRSAAMGAAARAALPMGNPYCSCKLTSYGVQLRLRAVVRPPEERAVGLRPLRRARHWLAVSHGLQL